MSKRTLNRAEFWQRCRYDLCYFAEHCLKIRLNTGRGGWRMVPLRFNPAQIEVAMYIEACVRHGLPVRIIIGKCRQLGMSTVIEAALFWICAFNPNIRARVIAHLQKSTDRIALICRNYATHLPKATRYRLQPHVTGAALTWPHKEGDSLLEAVTQGSTHAARGDDPSAVHISELALWEEDRVSSSGEDVLQALFSAIDEIASTFIAIESTSNGPAGTFFERYTHAMESWGRPGALWKPFFFGWQGVPKYSLDVSRAVKHDFTTMRNKAEAGLMEKAASRARNMGYDQEWFGRILRYDLTAGEAAWAMQTLRTKYNGNLRRFDMEFPLSWQLSFVSGGSNVFDQYITAEWQRRERPSETRIGGRLERAEVPAKKILASISLTHDLVAWSWHPSRPLVALVDTSGRVELYEWTKSAGTLERVLEGQVSFAAASIGWHDSSFAVLDTSQSLAEWFLGPEGDPDELWSDDVYDSHYHLECRRGELTIWCIEGTTRAVRLDARGDDWELYRYPEPGHQYLIVVDSASGTQEGDNACIMVFDRGEREFVAEFYGKAAPDVTAEQAVLAGHMYGNCWIVPERNNHGHATLMAILNLGWRRIYRRNSHRSMRYGTDWRQQLGWDTTKATRQKAIDLLASAIINETITVHSKRFTTECTTFMYNSRNRPEAMRGKHDDAVMTAAICLAADDSLPPAPLTKPESVGKHESLKERMKRSRSRRQVDPHLGRL